jgi:hypothetical protein
MRLSVYIGTPPPPPPIHTQSLADPVTFIFFPHFIFSVGNLSCMNMAPPKTGGLLLRAGSYAGLSYGNKITGVCR